MPLQALPLAAQSYELASRPADGRRLLNMHAERMPEAARSPFVLKPTPGLVPLVTVGSGPISAMAAMPGFLYVASGGGFFRVRSAGGVVSVETVGDIGAAGGAVTVAVGDRQVVVCNPPRAFVASHTGELREVTGGQNFPAGGASAVAYVDGYFCFTSYEGTFFFTSKLLDAEVFDPLDFAKSERRPDIVQHCVAHNGELWLFGLHAMSVWYDAGLADFPFRERAGAVQDRGVDSRGTVARMDRSLVFLGNDRIVYRTNGYQLVRISDHALEEKLAEYLAPRDITGFSFVWKGHEHYALRMPKIGRTYVYDGSTGAWHERSSGADGTGTWRVGAATQWETLGVLGSAADGRLYTMSDNFHTDDGVPIRREAVLPPLVADGARQFMARLEVEMDVGSREAPGGVRLDWSDDGGATWAPGRDILTGATGATRTRVAANRLGSFRQRLLRLRCLSRMTVYGVDADVAKGAH